MLLTNNAFIYLFLKKGTYFVNQIKLEEDFHVFITISAYLNIKHDVYKFVCF